MIFVFCYGVFLMTQDPSFLFVSCLFCSYFPIFVIIVTRGPLLNKLETPSTSKLITAMVKTITWLNHLFCYFHIICHHFVLMWKRKLSAGRNLRRVDIALIVHYVKCQLHVVYRLYKERRSELTRADWACIISESTHDPAWLEVAGRNSCFKVKSLHRGSYFCSQTM